MEKIMKRIFSAVLILFGTSVLFAQPSTTFEMRYLTNDTKADGVTDFHGETEWFNTDKRVEVLNRYADFASRFWGDPELDTPLFTDAQVRECLSSVKPQPTTTVRRTLSLSDWKAYGYKKGKEEAVAERWAQWTKNGAVISEGCLVVDRAEASPAIAPMSWRFVMKMSLKALPADAELLLYDSDGTAVEIDLGRLCKDYMPGEELKVYVDLQEGSIFLSKSDKLIREFTLSDDFAPAVTGFVVKSPSGRCEIDRFSLYNFRLDKEDVQIPFKTELVYDEDFKAVPSMAGWQNAGYDDSLWESVKLPSPHGALKSEGESYYLRTEVQVDTFRYAGLVIETLDPAGEVWVNGEVVAVLDERIPRTLDVTDYLLPGQLNTIAVRVKPYIARHSIHHAPNDVNIGWFLGRTSLILADDTCHLTENLVHTVSLDADRAVQHHKVTIRNKTPFYQKGRIQVNYYPWFPTDGECVASLSKDIELRPRMDNVFDFEMTLDSPDVWSTSCPQLYRVEVIFHDENGVAVDDLVTTTGVRVIEQKEGVLYINHKPEMLNGAQNFGYRLPIEYVSETIRCATDEMVMRDLMMSQCLGGNLLRIHVHAEQDVPDGVNDPRYAEYADQLGLYLIWQSAAWLREGEAWNVDIKNWPLYMKQVYNHPSIVLWEASNHPNRFKNHGVEDTEDYFNAIITTLVSTDTSRLVSPTSYWPHSYYANYDGTKDYLGNDISPNPILMHMMMTRGSQDAYTGYGEKWSTLRKYPYDWAKSCLDAKGLCYFNFEHEESAAQPNWNLSRMDPWHKMQSYEWGYEEGSIGRLLQFDEWRASQAFQAFSAWESMKLQTLSGVCGFSWCSLESGANMFTYQKPLVDPYYVPKLAFYANKMVFGRLWAASDDVDVVYGPGDMVSPVIFNLGEACVVNLTVELCNQAGRVIEKKVFKNVPVSEGRSVTKLEPFRFKTRQEGCCFLVYRISM